MTGGSLAAGVLVGGRTTPSMASASIIRSRPVLFQVCFEEKRLSAADGQTHANHGDGNSLMSPSMDCKDLKYNAASCIPWPVVYSLLAKYYRHAQRDDPTGRKQRGGITDGWIVRTSRLASQKG